MHFALFKKTEGKFFSFDDYKKAVEGNQTDKDKKVVYLYATELEAQYGYIEAAKNKGYDVLLMDCELDAHYVNLLEQKLENVRLARVDSDAVDNLIPKEEKIKLEMSENDKRDLNDLFVRVLPQGNDYHITAENLGAKSAPVLITQNEFMRRYREMSAMGGGMNFYGELPKSYNIAVNMEHPLIASIMSAKSTAVKEMGELPAEADKDATEEVKKAATDARNSIIDAHRAEVEKFADANELLHQVIDLALLSNGMLKGKALSDFVLRSFELISPGK